MGRNQQNSGGTVMLITLKGVIEEDTVNYKKISMVLEFPKCSFKCDKECGSQVCQNSPLASAQNIKIEHDILIHRYLTNPITEAIVCQGLEPFDSWDELRNLILFIREDKQCNDDIVIYTGYNKEEVQDKIKLLQKWKNIIVKFGRYIPDQESHYDEILGVTLASDNQYAERVS